MNRKRNQKEMYPLIEEYLSSELSIKEYSQEIEIAEYILRYWLKKFQSDQNDHNLESFSPVTITKGQRGCCSNIIVDLPNGISLQIPVD